MIKGICSWSFTDAHRRAGLASDPQSPEGTLALALEHDFGAVEIGAESFESSTSPATAAFARDLAANGLMSVVDTGGESPEELGPRLEHAVAIASALGSSVVRTTISRCLEGDRSRFGREGWKDHLAEVVAPLRSAARLAGGHGVAVGVENHQDVCSSELVWLCDAVDQQNFGVVLDVGNALAVGEDPLAFATTVMEHLKHVQLKDYVVHPSPDGWRFVRCAIGDGIVDFPTVLGAIDLAVPGLAACIETGASTARHVRLLSPSWWETFDERPFADKLGVIRLLHAHEQPLELDWRTPNERGEEPAVIAAYELDQFARSVEYVRKLP